MFNVIGHSLSQIQLIHRINWCWRNVHSQNSWKQFMTSESIYTFRWWITYSRRAQIALLPFWALFWVKNPFCNRDFLKVPFLSIKIHLFALFFAASWPFSSTKFSSRPHLAWYFHEILIVNSHFVNFLALRANYQSGPTQVYLVDYNKHAQGWHGYIT